MAQSEINRATKNRESVKKHIRLELTPTVADFVSAPSGRLRSLSVPSMAPFPENCSKPSQFPGAYFASWFKILCPLNKKTAHIFMHGTILSRLSDSNPPPPVADFVSAPSGRLRSLSPPSLAAFPGNCSKPSQFPGAHFASQFVFSLIYKKTVPFSCTVKFQADCQTRTDYLRVTSALLYLVS